MKREKQILESKQMISRAFLTLLGDSELNDITVTRITEEARVSRMTFCSSSWIPFSTLFWKR
jgi:hypothetical protein